MELGIDNVEVNVEGAAAFKRTAEEQLVHDWRIEQLEILGLSRVVAERAATQVDWHQVADLVKRGCSAELALEILRRPPTARSSSLSPTRATPTCRCG
jgi:hypothetical protein